MFELPTGAGLTPQLNPLAMATDPTQAVLPPALGMSPQQKVMMALQAQRGMGRPSTYSGLTNSLLPALAMYKSRQGAMPQSRTAPVMDFNPMTAGE